MNLMTTYSTAELMGNARPCAYKTDDAKQSKTILYPEIIYNQFQVKDAMDANNYMQMSPLALVETRKTMRWPNCAFQFLLAITKTNCWLAIFHLYGTPERSKQEFIRLFAKFLINNQIL